LLEFVFTPVTDRSYPRPPVSVPVESPPGKAVGMMAEVLGLGCGFPVFFLGLRGTAVFSDPWSAGFPSVPLCIDDSRHSRRGSVRRPGAGLTWSRKRAPEQFRSAKNHTASGVYLRIVMIPDQGEECNAVSPLFAAAGSATPAGSQGVALGTYIILRRTL
jgi:hypothetical protein